MKTNPCLHDDTVTADLPLTRKRVWWWAISWLCQGSSIENIDYVLAWRKAYFIGLHARLDDVALFHWLVQNQDCWLSKTKQSLRLFSLWEVRSGYET